MAIGVRDITNLEELLEVQDDDKIIVIQNGEAKLVSKANAKFGGGTVTIFYPENVGSSSQFIRLLDVNGNLISAQVAYDAAMSGPVNIGVSHTDGSKTIGDFFIPVSFMYEKIGEEMSTVAFDSINGKCFYAGKDPTGGVN